MFFYQYFIIWGYMSYPYKVNNAFHIFIKSQKLKHSVTVLFLVFPVFLFSKYFTKFFKMRNACLISTGHSCHITCLLSVYRYKWRKFGVKKVRTDSKYKNRNQTIIDYCKSSWRMYNYLIQGWTFPSLDPVIRFAHKLRCEESDKTYISFKLISAKARIFPLVNLFQQYFYVNKVVFRQWYIFSYISYVAHVQCIFWWIKFLWKITSKRN